MSAQLRRSLTAFAALALAAPLAIASTAQAAESGFTTVGSTAGTHLVSPTDGVAYLAGPTGLTRWTTSGSQAVRLPVAASGPMDLAAHGGVTYLLTGTAVVVIDGSTTSTIALPSTIPAPLPTLPAGDDAFTATSVAADAQGVWISGLATSGSDRINVILHWTGTAWELAAADPEHSLGIHGIDDLERIDGMSDVRRYTGVSGTDQGSGLRRWTGTEWVSLSGTGASSSPYGSRTVGGITYVTATDYTSWGSASAPAAGVPLQSACTHTVAGASTTCPVPTWPVSAAVRLADGRVVLGGSDMTSPAAVDGGFAVVDAPGAMPTSVAGDNDKTVRLMAAPPAGGTVWALTEAADGTSYLKVVDLAPPAPTPTPTTPAPTPTSTTPTTPAPTPKPKHTKAPKAPKAPKTPKAVTHG